MAPFPPFPLDNNFLYYIQVHTHTLGKPLNNQRESELDLDKVGALGAKNVQRVTKGDKIERKVIRRRRSYKQAV